MSDDRLRSLLQEAWDKLDGLPASVQDCHRTTAFCVRPSARLIVLLDA